MTKTCDEIIELIAAVRDKKAIQWKRDGSGWIDNSYIESWENILGLYKNGYDFRLKPAPAKRLIRADELPPIVWVRATSVEHWNLVIKVDGDALTFLTVTEDLQVYAAIGRIPNMANANVPSVWSPDRLSVKSFYIEEETK